VEKIFSQKKITKILKKLLKKLFLKSKLSLV
jgi:hypothetical protein